MICLLMEIYPESILMCIITSNVSILSLPLLSSALFLEKFVRNLLKTFATTEKHPKRKLTHLNFEFTPLTDEHFECATLPETLEDLNLNGCREISERTLMII